jgi:hypothetical protein
MLALDGPARRWEPKRLRLRLYPAAGRLVKSGRRLRLRLACRWQWADLIATAIKRLEALPPDQHQQSRQSRKEPPGPMDPRPPDATVGPHERPTTENRHVG